ncbi:MAG: dienelactone hydrolase family protein [Pseudomonadales bacterium]
MTRITQRTDIVDVDGSAMEVFVFQPDQDGPLPGLVLAQHIPVGHTGIENDTFTLATAERFAAAGFVVAAPFIFHRWPKDAAIERKRAEARDDWMVADVRAAFELLRRDRAVAADRIGVVGHCWGGRVAWLAACHLPDLAACAMFYGGRIKLAMGPGSVPAIDLAGNIRCPVIGFFGNDDANPSPADVDDYERALSAAGVSHTFYRYAGAGHAFQNFPTPERYRETASEDAWSKVLAFLARTLATEVPGR